MLLISFFCRVQYGLGHFRLGDIQTYHLLYEPHNVCLKIVVVQLEKNPPVEKQGEAFSLFLQLMFCLEESIFSVIDLYIPCTKYPLLHVGCPFCNNPNPHIMVEHASRISLSLPSLLCTQGAHQKILPKRSYLPFGDTLKKKHVGKYGRFTVTATKDPIIVCISYYFVFFMCVVGFKECEVFTTFFDKLANTLPVQNIASRLISARIITVGDDEEIRSIARTKEKAMFVLRKVAHSLDASVTESFYKLLTILEEHGSDAGVVAAEIRKELQKNQTGIYT